MFRTQAIAWFAKGTPLVAQRATSPGTRQPGRGRGRTDFASSGMLTDVEVAEDVGSPDRQAAPQRRPGPAKPSFRVALLPLRRQGELVDHDLSGLPHLLTPGQPQHLRPLRHQPKSSQQHMIVIITARRLGQQLYWSQSSEESSAGTGLTESSTAKPCFVQPESPWRACYSKACLRSAALFDGRTSPWTNGLDWSILMLSGSWELVGRQVGGSVYRLICRVMRWTWCRMDRRRCRYATDDHRRRCIPHAESITTLPLRFPMAAIARLTDRGTASGSCASDSCAVTAGR